MTGLQRVSRFESGSDVVVMKFGGTSVEDAQAIRHLIGIVRSRLHEAPIVVVSALAGVTDQLLESAKAAAGGHLGEALALARNLYVRHEDLADSFVEGSSSSALNHELRVEFGELESRLHDLEEIRQLEPKSQDHLLSFGERLSSKLVTESLHAARVNAAHVDAANCIVTDGKHGQANPLLEETNQRLQFALTPLLEKGLVPVMGGFIASTSDGVPTTLGRGGSDFSAAIVGAALSAARIEIWTDVDGIMTTDPKLCPEARVIPKISFDEAAEMAHLGAKVLHPATLGLAIRANIPVHILNSRRPDATGTKISARARSGNVVTAITAKKNVAAVEIEFQQTVDSELLRSVYGAFNENSCPVNMMTASLERMSLIVGSTEPLNRIASALRDVAQMRWENHRALVCLVGDNIRRQPQVASRVFNAVSDMEVRVLCQDASNRTISFLVEESKVEESVQRLHGVFFPTKAETRDWGATSIAFCQAG